MAGVQVQDRSVRPPVRAGRHTRPVRSYGQYCPVARGAEIFATRWTPIIVRNLLLGCRTDGELRAGAPGIPGRCSRSGCASSRSTGSSTPPQPARRAGCTSRPRRARTCGRCATRSASGARAGSRSLRSTSTPTWRCGACAGGCALPAAAREAVTIRFELREHAAQPAALLAARAAARAGGLRQAAGLRGGPRRATDRMAVRWVLGESSLGEGMKARRVEVEGRLHLVGRCGVGRAGQRGRAAATRRYAAGKAGARHASKVTQASLSG